jgi:hypothetical protein
MHSSYPPFPSPLYSVHTNSIHSLPPPTTLFMPRECPPVPPPPANSISAATCNLAPVRPPKTPESCHCLPHSPPPPDAPTSLPLPHPHHVHLLSLPPAHLVSLARQPRDFFTRRFDHVQEPTCPPSSPRPCTRSHAREASEERRTAREERGGTARGREEAEGFRSGGRSGESLAGSSRGSSRRAVSRFRTLLEYPRTDQPGRMKGE